MNRTNGLFKDPWEKFYGPNLGYIMELYETFLQDPDSVDPDLKQLFEEWGAPSLPAGQKTRLSGQSVVSSSNEMILKAVKTAEDIRLNGHFFAKLNPLKPNKENGNFLEKHQITASELKQLPPDIISSHVPKAVKDGWEAVQHLEKVYTNYIAFEFHHVENTEEKNWLYQTAESGAFHPDMTNDKKLQLYKRLMEVELFEQFLHRTFIGQKRFSIEGVDVLVPLLDEIISESVKGGAKGINIGMAHRGRLNVLAHVLGKPYEMIFAEFQNAPNKELIPSEGSIGITYGWTGDVKYHLGLDRKIKTEDMVKSVLTLANNPSHLEYVNPIVAGFTRAAQEERNKPGYPIQDEDKALGIMIHGDAAFPGQGVVAETLNLNNLKGYQTGGTIHIIVNNMIGFTTESSDSRSTRYASDVAKGFGIPIIHVNADQPEAVLSAARFALLYRQKFLNDILIDLIGYRRFGHNEMDEPMATNPLMYQMIRSHPTVKEIYEKNILQEKIINKELIPKMEKEFLDKLKAAHEMVPKNNQPDCDLRPPEPVEKGLPAVKTSVPFDSLARLNEELLKWPDGFQVFPKLERVLLRREKAFFDKKIDWGHAEALAFATILEDGIPIRLTGQDSERGTFVQRHLVLHDQKTGEVYSPLHGISKAKASFAIHNSPLSEMAVLGYEYGYNVFAPETLVLWEAQFGDFANSAQVILDQFISSGRAKWGQKSGLVMLLPHGYEGQGPEHSSARLERFLTLAAENNWTVANMTKSSQYFHILRRQALVLQREEVRPLVIMTPKSLLRHPLVASGYEELTEGEFKAVLEQPGLGSFKEKVERLVLCSGKIAVDLEEELKNVADTDWLHILRIEELYPFPMKVLAAHIEQYPNLKEIIWVQEEPKNMGAWTFVEPRIHALAPAGTEVFYIGRRRRSSTAEGDPQMHKFEQERIIRETFKRKVQYKELVGLLD